MLGSCRLPVGSTVVPARDEVSSGAGIVSVAARPHGVNPAAGSAEAGSKVMAYPPTARRLVHGGTGGVPSHERHRHDLGALHPSRRVDRAGRSTRTRASRGAAP